MKSILVSALGCMISVCAVADEPAPPPAPTSVEAVKKKDPSEVAIEKLMNDYKESIEKLGKETVDKSQGTASDQLNTTGADAYVGLEVKFGSHQEKISFDYPKVKMENQKFSMHLPQMTGTDSHTISWDEPYTDMEVRVVGKHPEVIPRGGFPPRFETRWKEITAHVPVVKSRRREVVISYPKITLSRNDWTIGMPVVTMERHEIIYTVPDVTVRDLKAEGKKLEKRSNELTVKHDARMKEVADEFRKQAEKDVKPLLDCKFDVPLADLQEQRGFMVAQFDSAITQLNATIKTLRENETSEDDKYIAELEKNVKETETQKSASIVQLDSSIKQLQATKKSTWEEFAASFRLSK